MIIRDTWKHTKSTIKILILYLVLKISKDSSSLLTNFLIIADKTKYFVFSHSSSLYSVRIVKIVYRRQITLNFCLLFWMYLLN